MVALALTLGSCSVDSARNHYVLAEKLWTDQKYLASVSEFEKVIAKDPRGKLGLQATYRAAMTQFLFLSQYGDAIRKFKEFVKGSPDSKSAWDAQLQIGEILFAKTEQYDQAISHYESLIQQNPTAAESPEFLFRIGKSYFFLFQFKEAILSFETIISKYPETVWAEKAMFEIGSAYFTQGEQNSEDRIPGKEAYDVAMNAYQRFIKHYPKSLRVPEARFGIASCLEELDQLGEAYQSYAQLKASYPSPQVIDVKLSRIRERIAQRSGRTR